MPTINQDFANIVARALNTHGHGFHNRVKKFFEDDARVGTARWPKINDEFPVQLQAKDTRVDLLLSRNLYTGSSGPAGVIVCECKRANPAVSNWVFFGSQPLDGYPVIETIFRGNGNRIATVPMTLGAKSKIYQLGMAIRADQKGDAELKVSTHSAIEDATTQVFRCANGLFETLKLANGRLWPSISEINILPIVITTAKLFTCSTDLNTADIRSGDIVLENEAFESAPWLFMNYPLSLSLRHSVDRLKLATDLTEFKNESYVRTLAIVNSEGLEDFVKELPWFENCEVQSSYKMTL